jgi:hypothetical protein
MLVSAHENKTQPVPLKDFVEREFCNNITAYKRPWKEDGAEDFPIASANDLGVSEKSFKALKILFPYLDKVFRAKGAEFIPQMHSTVANHLAGLQKICDEVFSDDRLASTPESLKSDFKALEKRLRLALLVHDLSELPGEISTFAQRLDSSEISEDDRHRLEKKLSDLLIYHSLKAVYDGKEKLDEDFDL